MAEDSEIEIFPIPADDYIEINFDNVETGLRPVSTEEIQIYNILGICVISYQKHTPALLEMGSEEGVRIDISNLSSGIYFLKIGDRVYKFVKM